MDPADVREAAIQTLVEVSITGMSPDRGREADAMSRGVWSILTKLFSEEDAIQILRDSEKQFIYYCDCREREKQINETKERR